MTKIDLLKSLIAKETDKAEIERLNGELLEAIREEEKAKLSKEFAAEKDKLEKELAQARSTSADLPEGRIEVGAPDMYKGRRFKMEVEGVQSLSKAFKDNPEKAEGITKTWLDALSRAKAGVYKAGMDEGTTTEGGFLTAPEYSNELLGYAKEWSRALNEHRVIPMNSRLMYLPAENAVCSMAQTAEAVDATETTPTFTQVTLTAKRFDAWIDVTKELMDDAYVPIVPILMSQLTAAMGGKIDSAVYDGTGDPMSSIFTAAVSYSQQFATGSTAFSEVLFTDFTKAVGKLPTARAQKAKWFVNRATLWTYLYSLRDSNGQPIFMPNAYGKGPGTILGYDVVQLENGPAATGVATALATFGDPSGVIIGSRNPSVDLFIDPYTDAKKNQNKVYLFTRWAFALALPGNFVRVVTAAS